MLRNTNSSLPICSSRGRLLCAVATGSLLLVSGCTRDPRQREAAHLMKGKDYVSRKQYREAIIEFKVAAQNMPKDPEPVYQLGMTYLVAGASKPAIDTLQKVLALDPKHQGAQYQMALYKVGSSKPETIHEAENVLAPFLKSHPNDAQAAGSLALAEAKLGNKDEALRLLGIAGAKEPSNTRPAAVVIAFYAATGDLVTIKEIARGLAERLPSSPEALILRGQVSLAAGDLDDADAQIGRALSLKHDFRPALELRLRREIQKNDMAAGEATTKELAKSSDEQTWGDYARFLFAEKKIDEGIAEFNRVLKEHGDNPALRDGFSALLIGAHRNKEAEAVLVGTLRTHPADKTALFQRTRIEIDNGDLNAASKDVKSLQELKAFSSALSYQESRIAGARGDTIHEGDLLAETLKRDPAMLSARLELARLLISANKAKDALTILDQASPQDKTGAAYVFYRNSAMMSAGQWEEVRKNVDSALTKRPVPGFVYQDAVLRMHSHDVTGARKSLEAGFQMAPADPLILGMLGRLMQEQGESQKFAVMLRNAAAKTPGSSILQDALGAQLAATGDTKGARVAFEAAKADGDLLNADCGLALLDIRSGALDQARQRLRESVKTHDSSRSRMMLAEIETLKGASPDAVIQEYLKALELEPANVAAMNDLAQVLAVRQNKLEDALFWAQKALATAPGNSAVQDTLGWILYSQGKYEAALPFLEKSMRTADRPIAHYHMAAVLLKAGDAPRAKREYAMALKQDPKAGARTSVGPLFEGK